MRDIENSKWRHVTCAAALIALTPLYSGCSTADVAYTTSAAVGGPVGQPSFCDWPQALGTPDHVGRACQPLHGLRVVAVLPQAPDAAAQNAADGFLQDNLGSTVTSGDFVAVPRHHIGNLDNPDDHTLDTWDVAIWRWSPSVTARGATPVHIVDVASTWKSVDAAVGNGPTNGYVQMFGVAFRAGTLYVPQASGRIQQVDPATGDVLATIDPFVGDPLDGDPRLIGSGGITLTNSGALLYTAMAWPAPGQPRGSDPRGSWLVKIGSDNVATTATWLSLTTSALGVPQRNDLCNWPFGTAGTPPATGPDSQPPLNRCGFQKPVINAAPAVRPTDGRVVLHSVSNNNIWSQWLIVVNPATMATEQAIPLRERMHYGCGVRLPLISDEFGDACDIITAHGTANIGNDPEFNKPVSLRAGDIDNNQPFCLLNGDCGVGGYDGGFAFFGNYDARGASLLFHPDGSLAALNEEFGWDATPTAWVHGGVTTLVQDRDLFSDLDLQVARYSSTFELQAVSAVPVDPVGVDIEFVDANTPVDVDGHSYGVNVSGGRLYQFGPDGQVTDVVTLTDPSTGAPTNMDSLSGFLARDRASRIYVPLGGNVFVIDGGGVVNGKPDLGLAARVSPSAELLRSMVAKASARPPTPVTVEPPPSIVAPHSAPNEIDCDPISGCTGGGGGDSCSAPCYTSADCLCGICFGADVSRKHAGNCIR